MCDPLLQTERVCDLESVCCGWQGVHWAFQVIHGHSVFDKSHTTSKSLGRWNGGNARGLEWPLKIHHRAPIPEVTRDWGSERIWSGIQRHTRRGGRVCTPPASRRSGAETDTREGEPRTVRHRAIGLGVRRESGVRSATAARGERGHTHQSACRCVRQRWTHSAKIGI